MKNKVISIEQQEQHCSKNRCLNSPIELIPFNQKALHVYLTNEGIPCLSENVLSSFIGLGTPELKKKLEDKVQKIIHEVGPLLFTKSNIQAPADILALDLAICQPSLSSSNLSNLTWDLSWVEIQAFTSMLGSFTSLDKAHHHLGNIASNWLAYDSVFQNTPNKQNAFQDWIVPHHPAVLIEDNPWKSGLRGDFEASQYWFGVDVHDWRDLIIQDGLFYHPETKKSYLHVLNRLIWSDLSGSEREIAKKLYKSAHATTWHSHPAWYERIHKGALVDVSLEPHEACFWVESGFERMASSSLFNPKEWVLKEIHGHSSSQVLLYPTLDDFLQLKKTHQRWLMQKRFTQMPLGVNQEGVPLFGEIRCMVGLNPSKHPVILAYLLRLSQNGIATMTGLQKKSGEGMTLLYFS